MLSVRNSIPVPLRSRYGQCTAWLALLILTVAIALPARAQLDTGSISGVITDPAGAVVPQATVAPVHPVTSAEAVTLEKR